MLYIFCCTVVDGHQELAIQALTSCDIIMFVILCVSCSVVTVPYQFLDHDGAKSLNHSIYC